jgi:hypothetical protein
MDLSEAAFVNFGDQQDFLRSASLLKGKPAAGITMMFCTEDPQRTAAQSRVRGEKVRVNESRGNSGEQE